MKHLINLEGWTTEEIKKAIEDALEIKTYPAFFRGKLKGKTLIMLFEKTSTRTRLSFETAMTQLGGHAIFLDRRTTQFKIADFIDEIRAVMRFGNILMYRPLSNKSLIEAEKVANIPIINACCEKYHPCQALGDALTMIENCGGKLDSLKGKKVVWLGVKNNVYTSLADVCNKLGAEISICTKEENLDCLRNADFVHTDTWIDMEFFDEEGNIIESFKKEFENKKNKYKPLQLSKKLLDKYDCKAKLMHCMPCHVGYEITRDAIDHPNSIILDQAENRLHIQKAIILKVVQ